MTPKDVRRAVKSRRSSSDRLTISRTRCHAASAWLAPWAGHRSGGSPRSRCAVAAPAACCHFVRRLVAIAVAVAVATSSAAFAASMDCPTMRARLLSHCCCPTGSQEHARLSCCNEVRESRVLTSSPREQTERPRLAPNLMVVAQVQPSDGLQVLATAFSRGLPAGTAGPPPVPLRI